MGEFVSFLQNNLADFWTYTGFFNATPQHLIMILVGIFFIYLAVAKEFEPMLLIPIGFGILVGNIPFNMEAGLMVGLYEEGSVLNILYQGVTSGWYPPLIFLGIGAMTDFSALISNPKLMLIGAAHICLHLNSGSTLCRQLLSVLSVVPMVRQPSSFHPSWLLT